MTHPLLDLGGSGALVHLAPANGFPPETYRAALAPLFPSHRVVSLPPRAMWAGAGEAPSEPGSWASLAEDLLAGLRRHELPPVIGIGHSFGAVASILAAVREPARFRALALLDPTILPPPMMDAFREQRRKGEILSRPLVQAARKRRDRFATAAEAFEYWRGKPLFHDWPDAAVHDYVRAMLRPDRGGGFGLAWRREWEAHYYESFHADTWAEIDRLTATLPLLVVGGEVSDTFLPEAAGLLRERLPWATHVTLPGRGHLFPQAAPAETGKILAGWLASL